MTPSNIPVPSLTLSRLLTALVTVVVISVAVLLVFRGIASISPRAAGTPRLTSDREPALQDKLAEVDALALLPAVPMTPEEEMARAERLEGVRPVNTPSAPVDVPAQLKILEELSMHTK